MRWRIHSQGFILNAFELLSVTVLSNSPQRRGVYPTDIGQKRTAFHQHVYTNPMQCGDFWHFALSTCLLADSSHNSEAAKHRSCQANMHLRTACVGLVCRLQTKHDVAQPSYRCCTSNFHLNGTEHQFQYQVSIKYAVRAFLTRTCLLVVTTWVCSFVTWRFKQCPAGLLPKTLPTDTHNLHTENIFTPCQMRKHVRMIWLVHS